MISHNASNTASAKLLAVFEATPPRELVLVGTKAVSSGVIISTYKPNGPLQTGTYGDAAE